MTTQVLKAYIQGTCSPTEARQVVAFLATEAGQNALNRLLDEYVPDLKSLPLQPAERVEAEQLFAQIQAVKAAQRSIGVRTMRPPTNRKTRLSRTAGWLVAATGSLLVAVASWWVWPRPAVVPMQVIRTEYGQIRTLPLPDGSVVTLNAHSSVRYAKQWAATQPREVWVEGEAFFEVVHTPQNKQFTVHLPAGMNVDVLGTRFNVYTRQAQNRVSLNTGRIQLRVGNQPGDQLLMHPGEMVMADLSKRVFYRKQVNAQALSSWRERKLVFDGDSVAGIARMLEDTYGVKVMIANPALRRKTVSGSLPGQNIETILNGLATVFDLTITRRNNHIILQ